MLEIIFLVILHFEMSKGKLNRQQKAHAITHLVLIALMAVGLIFSAVNMFVSCDGSEGISYEKVEKDVYNPNNKDHREPRRSYSRILTDLQDVQIIAAQKNGINESFSREELASGKYDVKRIATCRHYVVDELTHSSPYLVPKAATLLDDMATAFQDSIYLRGYDRRHRFIVTSVTRTREDVRKLSRGNVNATENSCHCYATTFDITYTRFDRPSSHFIHDDNKLYDILMQVASDFRDKGRCYVKWERQQKCLHITVR